MGKAVRHRGVTNSIVGLAMKKTLEKADKLTQEQLGDRIRIARKGSGLTAEEFAKKLGVTAKTVRGWEKARRTPRANQIVMMAGMLNVTAPWLLEGREDEFMEGDSEEAMLRGKLAAVKQKLAEMTELIIDIEKRLDDA